MLYFSVCEDKFIQNTPSIDAFLSLFAFINNMWYKSNMQSSGERLAFIQADDGRSIKVITGL